MRSLLLPVVVALAAAPTAVYAQSVTCADGTTSEAGRGACSHHGGIAKTRASEPKRETSTRKTETSGRKTTTTTRVRCNDGSTSTATGRGACSRHGGVAGDADRTSSREPSRESTREPTRESTRNADPSTSLVVRCEDGTISIAQGRGACSHHGGVAADTQARTPTRDTRTNRTRTTRQDTRSDRPWWGDEGPREGEPMARCVDGTISYSRHHRGTCSNHGGVREWLDD
jgi:hypothetical protein